MELQSLIGPGAETTVYGETRRVNTSKSNDLEEAYPKDEENGRRPAPSDKVQQQSQPQDAVAKAIKMIHDYLQSHYDRLHINRPVDHSMKNKTPFDTHHCACELRQLVALHDYVAVNLEEYTIWQHPHTRNGLKKTRRVTIGVVE